MLGCQIQYIFVYINFIIYSLLTVLLVCRSSEDRFDRAIILLILAPLVALFSSVTLATYYAVRE